VVALGNPGPAYAATRHNAGFILGDALAERWRFPAFRRSGRALVAEGSVGDESVLLVKPQTYMNLSGEATYPLLGRADFDPSCDLLVVVDELALPLGTFRLRARGSAGGHRGLESIEAILDSRDYARLRIGIGPLPPQIRDWADFVLAPFSRDELQLFEELLPTLADAVECWLSEGIDTAMNKFNRRGLESD
jgi:PTH1 family peptidyl-tRNA hydrolase